MVYRYLIHYLPKLEVGVGGELGLEVVGAKANKSEIHFIIF